jgi:hypothetical protein
MPETLNYQNRAIAYSVLAHIYDKGTLAHGPLDIFIPIVKNALSELYPLGVVKGNSMKEITDAIEKKFSLVIPISVLNNILKVFHQNPHELKYHQNQKRQILLTLKQSPKQLPSLL